MRRSENAKALQPDGSVPDGTGIGQEALHKSAAGTYSTHMRLYVHPLYFGDRCSQPPQAADSNKLALASQNVEPAARGKELVPIVEIRPNHGLDVERQAVVRGGGIGNPLQVLGNEQ